MQGNKEIRGLKRQIRRQRAAPAGVRAGTAQFACICFAAELICRIGSAVAAGYSLAATAVTPVTRKPERAKYRITMGMAIKMEPAAKRVN